jgi:hypothetical protein
MVVLKRERQGVGSYEGKHDVALIKRDGKEYRVAVKHGNAHWVGQATFQHGVVVSDELLCNTDVELSSPEVGTIQTARAAVYVSLAPERFALLGGGPSRNDLKIDLADPLAAGATHYPGCGLVKIEFRQVELIAAIGAFMDALPLDSLPRLCRVRTHHRLSVPISPPGVARDEFRQQQATGFAGGPGDEFRRIRCGLASGFKHIVAFVPQALWLEVGGGFSSW